MSRSVLASFIVIFGIFGGLETINGFSIGDYIYDPWDLESQNYDDYAIETLEIVKVPLLNDHQLKTPAKPNQLPSAAQFRPSVETDEENWENDFSRGIRWFLDLFDCNNFLGLFDYGLDNEEEIESGVNATQGNASTPHGSTTTSPPTTKMTNTMPSTTKALPVSMTSVRSIDSPTTMMPKMPPTSIASQLNETTTTITPQHNDETTKVTQQNNKTTKNAPEQNKNTTTVAPKQNNKTTTVTPRQNDKTTTVAVQQNNKTTTVAPQQNDVTTKMTSQLNNTVTKVILQPNATTTKMASEQNGKTTTTVPQGNSTTKK